jgi:membrane protease YdiL (CAAX protease family)
MWQRVRPWVRAVSMGLIVSGAPTIVWAVLVGINMKLDPGLPWSVPVMAVVLWSYWRYLGGEGPPRRLAAFRRDHLRAAALDPRTWRLALLAGGSAIAALWAVFRAVRGLLRMAPAAEDLSRYPVLTIYAAIFMGSLVAAVVEEAGFRGYMQVALERAYGPATAIATSSVVFALIHLTHGSRILPMLPFYAAGAVAYGLLALLTGSILPSLALHFAGDVVMFTMRYETARGHLAGAVPGEVSPGGLVAFVLFAALSAAAFSVLARRSRAGAPTRALPAVG